MKKKLMILGASILQVPAILKAKEMGIEVIAVDMNKNAIGFGAADICLDISTIDIKNIVTAAKNHKIDGIITLASDMPVRSVAAVAKELGLAGISVETAWKATNKALMRQCLKEHKVPIPKFFTVKNMEQYKQAVSSINGPFIVKPADNSGSRGVIMVNKSDDIESINYALEYSKRFSRCGDIVVEEYMKGPEVSVETISIDGSVYVIQITDKLTTGAPYFVETGHSQPSRLSSHIKDKIKEVAISAVNAIGIINGPSHTEIIVTDEGPKIVELGARLGGDNIASHLVPLSTGLDLVECSIKIALGLKADIAIKHNCGSAIKYFVLAKGRITDISGIEDAEQISGVKQISILRKVGDYVTDIKSSSDRIGFVIAQADNAESALSACEKAIKKVTIKLNRLTTDIK